MNKYDNWHVYNDIWYVLVGSTETCSVIYIVLHMYRFTLCTIYIICCLKYIIFQMYKMTYGSYLCEKWNMNLNSSGSNGMWYVIDIAFHFHKNWLAIWKEWNVDRMKCDMFLKLHIWWNIFDWKNRYISCVV